MIVGDITELCGYLKITKAIFLGQSMGGCIAMKLAQMQPDLTEAMILLASPGRTPVEELPLKPLLSSIWKSAVKINKIDRRIFGAVDVIRNQVGSKLNFDRGLVDIGLREAFRFYGFNNQLSQTKDIEEYLNQIAKVPTDLFLDLAADLEGFDIDEISPPLKIKSLIIAGRSDQIIPVSEAKRIHNALVNSKLEILPHGSHCPHFDDPHFVNSLIHKFVITILAR